MGRGAGCASSRTGDTAVQPSATPPKEDHKNTEGQSKGNMATTKIYIIYYSTYGHVAQLAKKEKEGVDSVPGCEGILYQVKETLPAEVIQKMHAPPQPSDIPFADSKILPEADGFLFGFPTRYGNVAGQFKTFWDSTGGLWQAGKLTGKPFGTFTSNATLGGGQGYAFGPKLFALDEVRGGSPWGAGTFAGGDGSRQPTQIELDQAVFQGKYTAEYIKKIAGK